LVDAQGPYLPFGLRARNLFVRRKDSNCPIFLKKIYSEDQAQKGAIVMAPGIASNANLFRVRVTGEVLTLDHDESFANLLAASGYTVYLYHPGYCERVINRYVIRHCLIGNLYGTSYTAPSDLDFDHLVSKEIPFVVEAAFEDNGKKPVSWIGFSLGGMLMYAYLPEDKNGHVKNVITIGSPVSLNNFTGNIISGINWLSAFLGYEDRLMTNPLTKNLIPITNLLGFVPGIALRFNPFMAFILNPTNISSQVMFALLTKVVEPIPAGLSLSFIKIIESGKLVSFDRKVDYLQKMIDMGSGDREFLFIHGEKDHLVKAESVRTAHNALSADCSDNIYEVKGAGHDDLVVGITSEIEVWHTVLNWLNKHPI
jgi:pimeloyl-ACP methyl ester carboxylesterase